MKRSGHYFWMIVVALLLVATSLSFPDRQVLSVSIINIRDEIPISDVEYGFVNNGFLISYALMFTLEGVLQTGNNTLSPLLIREPGMLLEKYLASELPENAKMPDNYSELPHMFLTTVRTILKEGENLDLKIRTISADNMKPTQSLIFWRTPGESSYKTKKLSHTANGVYEVQLASEEFTSKGLEYYVEVKFGNGDIKRFPATAPDINQTVILLPE